MKKNRKKVSHRAALVSIVSFGKNATCAQRDSFGCSRLRVTFSLCLELNDVMNINSQRTYAFHLSFFCFVFFCLFFV